MAPSTLIRFVLLAFVIAAAVAPGAAFAQEVPPNDDREIVEDDTIFIAALLNDDPSATTITDVEDPANGTVSLTNSDTTIIYNANPDYCNEPGPALPDTFTYDNDAGETPTVSVTVTCVDDKPVANHDSPPSVVEDSGMVLYDVLDNDTDIDSNTIEIESISAPSNGRVTASLVEGTGADPDMISVTPKANRAGGENVIYTVNGGDTATLSIDIADRPDPSFANDDTRTFALNLGTAFIDVLSNDVDADNLNSPDEIPILSVTQPGNGSTRIVQGTGAVAVDKIAYTPKAGTCGTDSFTYTIDNDLVGGTDTATVTITVSCAVPAVPAVPAAPTATAKAGKLKVSGTTVRVPLTCGKVTTCKLSLRLTSKKTVLGRAKATLKAGQKKTVKLKLNTGGKRKLKRSRRLKAKLRVTLGGKALTTKNVTFKAKRK